MKSINAARADGFERVDGFGAEITPEWTLTREAAPLGSGEMDKLCIRVNLPGVTSAANVHARVESTNVHVHVPGKYKLDLPLQTPVRCVPYVFETVIHVAKSIFANTVRCLYL
jgi:hypothetical protein